MLKGNLATRPFYNEGLVNLLLVLLAVGAVALAIFNTTRTIYLKGEEARRTVVQRDAEAETVRLNASAATISGRVDRNALLRLGAQTAEANAIIDARNFSWTVFFGLVEKTIPMDARLISVAPNIDRGVFKISMQVNAKQQDDLQSFIDALLSTGAFVDTFVTGFNYNDDGSVTGVIQGGYIAPGSSPSKPAVVKTTPTAARPRQP